VFPAVLADVGTGSFWFPEFGPALDSVWIDKSALKMKAFNTIKFPRGAIVPKEFFISAEFTVAGGSNNTITMSGDSHDQPSKTTDKSRVVMLNSDGVNLTLTLLDSLLVESSTKKPIYSNLYMTAYADTGTSYVVPKVLTTPVTKGYVGVQYKYNLRAGGVPRPAYKVISGPSGLAVDWYSGEVRWTPAVGDVGKATVTVEAFNANGFDRQTWDITVIAATQPKITSFPKKVALVGEPYFYQVTATGGPEPTYTLATTLTGLTLDPITGQLKITPTAGQVGVSIVGITARNAVGSDQQTFSLKIEATASAPKISTQAKTTGTVNQPYSYQVASSGNPQPTFSLTLAPPGMTVDQYSGIISWTPSTIGIFDVKVKAENRIGTDEQAYSLNIGNGASLPVFTSTPRTTIIAEQNFVDTVVATANPAPHYSLLLSPDGMKIDSNKGIITWRPSRDQKGPNAVSVRAYNTAGAVTLPYTIDVQIPPRFTSSEVFTAEALKLYQYQVTAEAEPAALFTLATAPTGMVMNAITGLISWTPTLAQKGQHPVKIVATNPAGTAEQSFTIDVTSTVDAKPAPGNGSFALTSLWPNPITNATPALATWSLDRAAVVTLEVRTLHGQLVSTLVDGLREAGSHSTRIDTRGLPAGVYYVVLRAAGLQSTKLLTVLR
jgi:hypothetical protein